MEPNYQLIGKRLQDARKSKGLTQQALADIMGVSVSYIKSTERGSKPSIKYLFVVANNCHVSFDWLLTGVQNSLQASHDQQKIEAVFDPDLKRMIDVLKSIMSSDNPHMRSWAIIQFEKAFADHCAALDEKKQA